MHWFGRRPIWRWSAVTILVAAAAFTELRPAGTVMHPFAAADIAAGGEIDDIEWRAVPAGLLPVPPSAGVATVDISSGEPLLPSLVTATMRPPPGWWSVPFEFPHPVVPGTRAKVILTGEGPAGFVGPVEVEGIVVSAVAGDGFGPPAGLVAVPGASAARVAAAVSARSAVLLLEP